jgi:hypothetical protein
MEQNVVNVFKELMQSDFQENQLLEKMIYVFNELMESKSIDDYFYNFSEVIEYFLDDYQTDNKFTNLKKLGAKIALLYASILLNSIEDKESEEFSVYSYFIIGRILLILGIPVYAQQYLKEAQRLSKHEGYSNLINEHLIEISRKYTEKTELFEKFSNFNKDIECIELNDFNEIFIEAIDCLENTITYELSLLGEYTIVSKIYLDIIKFEYKNISNFHQKSLFVDKKIQLCSKLFKNNKIIPIKHQLGSLVDALDEEKDKELINKIFDFIKNIGIKGDSFHL